MTTHQFDSWADWTDAADGPWGTTECADQLQAAINTLKDVVKLTEENLPAAVVAWCVQTIARACLVRLGVACPPVEDSDRCGQCFPDDDPPF